MFINHQTALVICLNYKNKTHLAYINNTYCSSFLVLDDFSKGTVCNFFFLQGMDVPLFRSAYDSPKFDFLLSHAAYCQDVLKLRKGQRAVISNGRVSHTLKSLYLWKKCVRQKLSQYSDFLFKDHRATGGGGGVQPG